MVKSQRLVSAQPRLATALSLCLHSQTIGWGRRSAEMGTRVRLETTTALGAQDGEGKLVSLFKLLGTS